MLKENNILIRNFEYISFRNDYFQKWNEYKIPYKGLEVLVSHSILVPHKTNESGERFFLPPIERIVVDGVYDSLNDVTFSPKGHSNRKKIANRIFNYIADNNIRTNIYSQDKIYFVSDIGLIEVKK